MALRRDVHRRPASAPTSTRCRHADHATALFAESTGRLVVEVRPGRRRRVPRTADSTAPRTSCIGTRHRRRPRSHRPATPTDRHRARRGRAARVRRRHSRRMPALEPARRGGARRRRAGHQPRPRRRAGARPGRRRAARSCSPPSSSARPRAARDAPIVVVAGGFSYADALGAGRMFALDLTAGARPTSCAAFVAAGQPGDRHLQRLPGAHPRRPAARCARPQRRRALRLPVGRTRAAEPSRRASGPPASPSRSTARSPTARAATSTRDPDALAAAGQVALRYAGAQPQRLGRRHRRRVRRDRRSCSA